MRKEQKYWRVVNSGLWSDLGSGAGSCEQSQVDHVWPRAAKVIRFSWKHISYFLLFKFFVRALFGLMNSLNLFSCDGFHLGEDEITHATVTFSHDSQSFEGKPFRLGWCWIVSTTSIAWPKQNRKRRWANKCQSWIFMILLFVGFSCFHPRGRPASYAAQSLRSDQHKLLSTVQVLFQKQK